MMSHRIARSARVVVALLSVLIFASAPRSHAAPAATKILQQGLAAYDDLDYAASIKLLEEALAKGGLSKADQIKAWDTIAFDQIALDRTAEGEAAFWKSLALDPQHKLPEGTSPKIQKVFDAAAMPSSPTEVSPPAGTTPTTPTPTGEPAPPAKPLETVVIYPIVTPPAPSVGDEVQVAATKRDPSSRVVDMWLYHRTRQAGGGSYARVKMDPIGNDRFAVTLPGTLVAAPALEYYLVGEDDAGPVASSGSEPAPLVLVVKAQKKTPFYGTWWFWTAAGAVVVGGVVTGVAIGTGGSADMTPANVTIVPH